MLLLALPAISYALPPPSDVAALQMRAEVQFYEAGQPEKIRLLSNRISIQLLPVRALAFGHAAQVLVQPGQPFAIALTLRNAGNIAVPYLLTLNGDLGVPDAPLKLVLDANGNGRQDADEIVLDLAQQRYLAYAAYDSLLLIGELPAHALAGAEYKIDISASVPDFSAVANTSLILQASTVPYMNVTLEAKPRRLDVGQRSTVTARVRNGSQQALLKDKTVRIDHRAEQVSLLRYRIPDGMAYVADSIRQTDLDTSVTLLFASEVDAEFDYRTMLPAQEVREIAIALRSALAPQQSQSMTFQLQLSNAAEVQTISRAEAYDSATLLPTRSNEVIFARASAQSPDIVPRIIQSDSGATATWVEIGVENIGAAATAGTLQMRGEIVALLRDDDISAPSWRCRVTAASAARSTFSCSNDTALPAGGNTPPVSIQVPNDSSGASCGPHKTIQVTLSVPNEESSLTTNNSAQAALLCKGGAVISGRAWIDADNNGIYAGGEVLSGWRAQLLRAGSVVKEVNTGADGRYRITGIIPDSGYSLRFLSPQGRLEATPLDQDRQSQSGIATTQTTRDFLHGTLLFNQFLSAREYADQNLALLPSGVIFNEQTGVPLPNVKVTLMGPKEFNPDLHLLGGSANVTTISDAHGRYNFFLTPSAPAGVYRWQAQIDGFEAARSDDVLELMIPAPIEPGRVKQAHLVFNSVTVPDGLIKSRGRELKKMHTAVVSDAATEAASSAVTDDEQERSNGYFIVQRVQDAKKPANNHFGLFPLYAGDELYLEKTADRKTVEIIDMFHYRLKVGHRRATAYPGFIINDSLPRGLRYLPGSARLLDSGGESGTALPDPVIEQGSDGGVTSLRFDFSSTPLQPNTPLEISYRVAVGATVAEGVRLLSYAEISTSSEVAKGSASIRVIGGVFSNDAFVLGKVFLDCNGDQMQNADEPGVPGVRVYLEDGSFAETDRNGNYSLYGLKPLTHVLKMDALTLPSSARALVLSSRNAGRGDSRFLDLRNGELGRGDFALSCSAAILAEVAYRREQLAQAGDELDSALKLRMDAEVKLEQPRQNVQGDRASGWIADRVAIPSAAAPVASAAEAVATQHAAVSKAPNLPLAAPAPAPAPSAIKQRDQKQVDALLHGDTRLRLVDLADGQIMPGNVANVAVLGSNVGDFVLEVNGATVSQQQVGQRSALASKQAALWEYIAVPLRSGKNTIAVRQGAQRQQVEVIVAGPAANIEIELPPQLFADGKTVSAVVVRLRDKDGVAVSGSNLVTLYSDLGHWITDDANPDAKGLQVLLKDGQASVLLKAPSEAGSTTLRVEHGALQQEVRLQFQAALRPMIAVGIVEGMLTLNNGKIEMAGGAGNNGFERELRTFARRSADGKRETGARAALFLKGQVKGEYLLTASFDSDKDGRDRLFRDIEPDKYYPVYGDDSLRGFDAQASSKLYLRIDKGHSYLVYGDFNTAESSQMRQLTQYSRAVNGVRHHFEKGPVVSNVFASYDSLRQQVISFRAANTRFYPGKMPSYYVEGSERVELVTYDRAQGGIGQRIKVLSRNTDYSIDELSGSFQVVNAEPSIDSVTGGENFYRITFEVEDGGEQSWLYGGDVTVQASDTVRIGAMAVKDENPNQPRNLQGIFGSWKLTPNTEIDGEYAWTYVGEDLTRSQQSSVMEGSGTGWRVGAKHNGAQLQSELSIMQTSSAFSNLSAPLAGGRFQARAKGVYRIDDQTRLKSEVLRTHDRLSGSSTRFGSGLDQAAAEHDVDGIQYSGALLSVERDLGDTRKLEVGTRMVRGAISRNSVAGNSEQEIDLLTLRTRLSSAVPGLPMATVYGEYEQDVRSQEKRALALGADYALSSKGRLYARHELISSLGSAYEIEEGARSYRTLVGIEGDYMEGGRAFSEFRGARPLTERGPETAYGTRNTWQINDKLNVRGSFERTRALGGSGGSGGNGSSRQSDATSISSVFEYRHSQQLKGATGLDVRYADSDTSYLYTLGVGYRLDQNWTLLGKNALYLVRPRGTVSTASGSAARANTMRSRQRIGLAYRHNQGNRLNALAYYEHRSASGSERTVDQEKAHIFSTHANFQPMRRWTMSGRYAAKYKTMSGLNGRHAIHGNLLSGRVMRDIGKRWDAGIAASVFADSLGQRKQAYGLEVGYQLQDDLWVSGGYNVIGFYDRDFAGMEQTRQGVYVRVRYKFDENSF